MIAHDVKARRMAQPSAELWRPRTSGSAKHSRKASGPENIIGNSTAARGLPAIHQVAASEHHVPDPRRIGHGQGAGGHGDPLPQRPQGGPVHQGQLRRPDREPAGERAVRPREGAFTGAVSCPHGRIEEAERRHAVPGRDRRLLARRSRSSCCASCRSASSSAWAATTRSRPTCGSSPPPTATWRAAVKAGRFRQDLYYRINVFPIWLPPLRERRDDILLLADHFVEKYAKQMGKTMRRISTPAINMMIAYHWPGNVRELENCIEHAVLATDDGVIHGHHLPPTLQMPEGPTTPPPAASNCSRPASSADLITDALKRTGGNINATARELGISPRMVRYKIEQSSHRLPEPVQAGTWRRRGLAPSRALHEALYHVMIADCGSMSYPSGSSAPQTRSRVANALPSRQDTPDSQRSVATVRPSMMPGCNNFVTRPQAIGGTGN